MPEQKTLPEAGSSSELWKLAVRNDFAKALHGALLTTLGVAAAKEFWAEHPLVRRDGRELSERELAAHVWSERALSPVAWTMSLVNRVEAFVIERGVDFEAFSATMRRFANQGSFVETRHLLSWLGPILVPMFRFGDPHRLLLQGARLVSTRMSPGVDFRLPRWREAATPSGVRHGSVWATYPGLATGAIPAWDFTLHTGQALLISPRIFDLPPYGGLTSVCDARAAETVLWVGAAVLSGDRLLVDGRTSGRQVSLHAFLDAAGYEPAQLDVPNQQVMVMDRDYRCPVRRRTVLSQGCAYGAPGYLVRFSWSPSRPRTKNFLWFAHDELAVEGDTSSQLEDLQRRYLETLTRPLSVAYHPGDGSIAVGGRHVCRGVPARILLECVRTRVRDGRSEFSYREFKRLPSLVSHPKNTGFETRLLRLRAALVATDCGLTIEPRGRGRFELCSSGPLVLDEHGSDDGDPG